MSVIIDAVEDSNFDDLVVKADKPVMVYFWAPWCAPCKMLAPIFEEIVASYQNKMNFFKMNVEQNEEIPAKLKVLGIPFFAVFKNGELSETKSGFMNKQQFSEFVEELLNTQRID